MKHCALLVALQDSPRWSQAENQFGKCVKIDQRWRRSILKKCWRLREEKTVIVVIVYAEAISCPQWWSWWLWWWWWWCQLWDCKLPTNSKVFIVTHLRRCGSHGRNSEERHWMGVNRKLDPFKIVESFLSIFAHFSSSLPSCRLTFSSELKSVSKKQRPNTTWEVRRWIYAIFGHMMHQSRTSAKTRLKTRTNIVLEIHWSCSSGWKKTPNEWPTFVLFFPELLWDNASLARSDDPQF